MEGEKERESKLEREVINLQVQFITIATLLFACLLLSGFCFEPSPHSTPPPGYCLNRTFQFLSRFIDIVFINLLLLLKAESYVAQSGLELKIFQAQTLQGWQERPDVTQRVLVTQLLSCWSHMVLLGQSPSMFC